MPKAYQPERVHYYAHNSTFYAVGATRREACKALKRITRERIPYIEHAPSRNYELWHIPLALHSRYKIKPSGAPDIVDAQLVYFATLKYHKKTKAHQTAIRRQTFRINNRQKFKRQFQCGVQL